MCCKAATDQKGSQKPKQVRKLNWIAEPELWLLFNVHIPNQTKISSSSKPNKNQPHQTKRNLTTPNQTHPYQTELNYTKPNSSIPNQTHQHQTKLIHTKPNSTAPNQTHPYQTKPSQTIHSQIWPTQTGWVCIHSRTISSFSLLLALVFTLVILENCDSIT